MIAIKCDTKDKLPLGRLSEFQGNLKKRSKKSLEALKKSIKEEGLLSPFFVWKEKDACGDMVSLEYHLLDGHSRLVALKELAEEDPDIKNMDLPVVFISADNEEDAKKHLLQITSSYGKVNKEGLKNFCTGIEGYVAPITRVLERKERVKRELTTKNETVLRIVIETEDLEAVLKMFEEAGIRVIK